MGGWQVHRPKWVLQVYAARQPQTAHSLLGGSCKIPQMSGDRSQNENERDDARCNPDANSTAGTNDDAAEITQWLSRLGADDSAAGLRLFELLYGELRRLAGSHLRREDAGHTLSATGLAHEVWFRMADQNRTHWQSRGHFLAVASTMMRRILVNHELAKRAQKRGAQRVDITESGLDALVEPPDRDVVAVHEALLAFETIDPRAAKVVELRFFGGLENEEVAEALGLSLATVKRDWTLARAWLQRELGTR